MTDSRRNDDAGAVRSRPLAGTSVIITRAKDQSEDLHRSLHMLGARVLEAPTIQLLEPEDWVPVDQAFGQLSSFDWIVFTSANGVDAVADRFVAAVDRINDASAELAGLRYAAIGSATAAVVQSRLGVKVDLVPPKAVAESLAAELIRLHALEGRRVLLLRADIARKTLPQLLREAGAVVHDVAVYRTRPVDALPAGVLDAMRHHAADWIIFTSASTARGMVQLLGAEQHLLDRVRIVSIGPITSDAVRQLGFHIDAEAATADLPGLLDALVAASSS